MGSTNSSTNTQKQKMANDSSSTSDICCLSPRPAFKQIFQKIRRTLKRHLQHSQKTRCGGLQRRCGARTALLRPMPRCSSFGSYGTLLTPTKKQKKHKTTPSDSHYAQWKCMFEHASAMGNQLVPTALRPHDISEALSGQTTPRGFPSHTDVRRCPPPPPPTAASEQPLYDCVGELKVRRRLSFRLPSSSGGSSSSGSHSVRRMTARQKAAQAKLEAQLQRELCDLEDYYGGFHYARRNERRI